MSGRVMGASTVAEYKYVSGRVMGASFSSLAQHGIYIL